MDDPGRPNTDTIPSIALEDIDPDKCYFNPGCAMSLYKPEAVEEILHLLNRRFLPTKLHTTCCRHDPELPAGSTIINNCQPMTVCSFRCTIPARFARSGRCMPR